MKNISLLLVTLFTLCGFRAHAEVVFSGEHAVGSWNAQQLPVGDYPVLAKASAGDVIAVTISDAGGSGRVTLQDTSWSGFADEYNCADGRHYFVLNETTAATVKANGLIVTGENYTLTQVELLYKMAIWEGTVDDNSGWEQSDALSNGLFAGLSAGDVLGIDVTAINDGESWHQVAIRVDYADNMISASTSEAKTLLYELTADQVTTLQTKTINVIAQYLKVSALYTYVEDKSTLLPLTLSVPVTDSWVFSGKPTITIHVVNDNEEDVNCNASVTIVTDKLADVTTLEKQETVTAGSNGDITLTTDDDLAAGIYKATCTVNGMLAREFFFAVNPTSIVSAADKQSDFDTFWATAKSQLDAIDIDATLTEITSKSTSARKVYLVEMQSVPDGLTGDPVIIRGYYCEPTDGEKHPIIMHYQGYDSGYRPGGEDVTPYCPSGDANPDLAEFILSTRGQSVNNRLASEREDGVASDFTNTYGDWFAFNFGNKDSYYYRGAYMDCVRAIQFMASRETSDMNNLYAEGQSQGGAFTYAAAALSGYTFNAIAPAITFMGDFPDYFDIASWPASVARENQGEMTDAEMFAFLSYFDTKNLATLIDCPVITSIGLQDNVCPPHTNIAPYNNVLTDEADKQIIYNAELQHQVNGEWYSTYMAFFDNYAASTGDDSENIWTGSISTGDWGYTGGTDMVALSYDDKGNLANARMNDYIKVTYTVTASGAQLYIQNPNGWTSIDGQDDDSYDAEADNSGKTFTLTISDATTLEGIQQNGILVRGKYVTITSVDLYKPADRYDAVPLTIGDDGIATFGSSKNLDFSGLSDVTPYYVSGTAKGQVTLTSVSATRGWAGYIVKGTAGSYSVPVTESDIEWVDAFNNLRYTGDYDGNWVYRSCYSDFEGTDDNATKIKTYYRYIFAKDKNNNVGFFKLATDHETTYIEMERHKAYLETATDITPTAGARVALVFDNGETTSISTVPGNARNTDGIYNLSGQLVGNGLQGLKKGIYVVRSQTKGTRCIMVK
jgi:cephalosporin-C deacetylase